MGFNLRDLSRLLTGVKVDEKGNIVSYADAKYSYLGMRERAPDPGEGGENVVEGDLLGYGRRGAEHTMTLPALLRESLTLPD